MSPDGPRPGTTPQVNGEMLAGRPSDKLSVPQIRAVVAVGRLGSFTAAGRMLGISQPAVSRAVAGVEDVLGVSLLDRTTRKVRLTKAGELFIERAVRILEEMDAVAADVRDLDSVNGESLSVVCAVSVSNTYLASTLTRFAKMHPDVRVTVDELQQPEIEDAVASGRAELGIANLGNVMSTLATRELWQERYHLCVSDEHPLAGSKSVRLEQISNELLVLLSHQGYSRFGIDPMISAIGRLHTPRLRVQQYGSAFELVRQGHGVMVVPEITTFSAPPGVSTPPFRDETTIRTVGAVWLEGREPSGVANAFVDALLAVRAADRRVGRPRH